MDKTPYNPTATYIHILNKLMDTQQNNSIFSILNFLNFLLVFNILIENKNNYLYKFALYI